MNRSVRSVLLTPVLVSALSAGCMSKPSSVTEPDPPFVFRSLDLSQRREDGSRDWELSSPEARYDLNSRTVEAEGPAGLIFRSNEPYLRVSADRVTVVNDGQRIVLEGNVRLQQLQDPHRVIEGGRLVWTPDDTVMVVDQKPKVREGQSELQAERFVLTQGRDLLTLAGPTRVLLPDSTISGGSGAWNLQTGHLTVEGPLTGLRADQSVLTASGLKGNTTAEVLDLMHPVTLRWSKNRGSVVADTTRWHYSRGTFHSDGPMQGSRQGLRMEGIGFVIDERLSTLKVSSACRLEQPGEQLEAERCRWNWRSNEIVAERDGRRLEGRVRSEFHLAPAAVNPGVEASTSPVRF